jgi:uncharacterized protein (DUF302 family)
MDYGMSVTVSRPYDEVVAATRAALAEQGFGVLTEIDVRGTLQAKLGVEVPPQVILGACNPELAHRALEIEPDLGLLLPCNVVVRSAGSDCVVSALDPDVMVQVPNRPELASVAGEARTRLERALADVADGRQQP